MKLWCLSCIWPLVSCFCISTVCSARLEQTDEVPSVQIVTLTRLEDTRPTVSSGDARQQTAPTPATAQPRPGVRPAWLLALGVGAVLLLLLAGLCPLLAWWLQRKPPPSKGDPELWLGPPPAGGDTLPLQCVPTAVQSAGPSPLHRTRGLLERRGSNASLTLDLQRTGNSDKQGSGPYLASRRLTRAQLRCCLSNVAALHSEFWDIPMNHPERAAVPGCGGKNRYRSILPNEHSRVLLGPGGDYINANRLRGFKGARSAYIATQGPLPHTVADFWAMVWQERAPVIVMITNLVEDAKVKCEQYLPEGEPRRFGEVGVAVLRTTPRDGYTLRELALECRGEQRRVAHLWYTSWPDHGTPACPQQLLSLAREAEQLRSETGPLVVHCSAGLGRTGCFVASSIGMQQLEAEGSVDVLATVCALRGDRGGMVQTAEQYEFVHRTLCLFEQQLP
ncbi:unnamed protein product [Ixodes pacificus]